MRRLTLIGVVTGALGIGGTLFGCTYVHSRQSLGACSGDPHFRLLHERATGLLRYAHSPEGDMSAMFKWLLTSARSRPKIMEIC
jgi:hypothetical protein